MNFELAAIASGIFIERCLFSVVASQIIYFPEANVNVTLTATPDGTIVFEYWEGKLNYNLLPSTIELGGVKAKLNVDISPSLIGELVNDDKVIVGA